MESENRRPLVTVTGPLVTVTVADRTMKKRRRSSSWPKSLSPVVSNIFLIVLLVAWSETSVQQRQRQRHCVDGFVPPQPRYHNVGWSKIAADSNHNGQDESSSWSKSKSFVQGRTNSSRSQRKGSRLQVRRRVRAVLEKARIRTGVKNGSVASSPPPPPRSTPTVVAEAAALGGLGDGAADIVFTKSQTVSASASASIYKNGETNGASNATATISDQPKNGSSQPTNNTNAMLFPDEELGLEKKNGVAKSQIQNSATNIPKTNGQSDQTKSTSTTTTTTTTKDAHPRKPKDFDVIRGDIPSANAFVEPLPFKLPNLSADQKKKLVNGDRLQEQSRMGREGSGYVVLDVEAPAYVVWECLLDFESYPELIPTVKSMQLYTSTKLNTGFTSEKPVLPGTGRETRHYGTPSITRASFILSKFRLNIAAIHQYTPHPQGDYMDFTLDPSCTNVVLKGAKGTWYTEENPDGREGVTRVYLLAGLQISRALPKFIVDYAAERAMPRATNWLKSEVEALKEEWLGEDDPSNKTK